MPNFLKKKPKRVYIGSKKTVIPGKVFNEGEKTTTEMKATAGTTKRTYVPTEANTKHEAYYGVPGESKSKIRQMTEEGLAKGRAEKKEIVELPVGKGGQKVPLRAGEWREETTPPKFETKVKVNPRLQLPGKTIIEPIYKSQPPIKQHFGKGPKRRLKHVDYLEKIKRNKKTESGYGRR